MTIPDEDNAKSLVVTPTYDIGDALVRLAPQVERARELIDGARADATRKAYAADWRMFEAWCAGENIDPTTANPPIVALYLTHMHEEGLTPNTIERAYCGVATVLRAHAPDVWPRKRRPLVIDELIQGIRRASTHVVDRKDALSLTEFFRLAAHGFPGEGLALARNRALLLIGFAGAFRRSELVGLQREDVALTERGLLITLRRSKTDQEGKGHVKAIVGAPNAGVCPIDALKVWLRSARASGRPIREGTSIFRSVTRNVVREGALSDRTVARIVKTSVASIGLDEKRFSGHSLRIGFVTSAALAGKSLDAIMRQTGHKHVEQVREYIRHATVFDDNATDGLFVERPR